MGIYDREYYRREGPSFLRSLTEGGKICKWLVAVNVVFFVVQIMTGGENSWFTDALQLKSWDVVHGEVWRLVTYAFLHSYYSIWHILFNMLFLWWFGTELEELYGPWEFLAVYLTAAVLGGVAYVVCDAVQYWDTLAQVPGCIGASGAVTAVMVLYACHFPTRRILLFWLLPIPVWLFVLIAVAGDTFGFLTGQTGGVAVSAHLGGAAFGFLYFKRQWRMLGLWSWLNTQRRPRTRLRVYREESAPAPVAVSAPAAAKPDVDELLEAKLDAVLEKVARYGQESLTDGERQILFRASEVYKRRRT